jgi:hypothetical protein
MVMSSHCCYILLTAQSIELCRTAPPFCDPIILAGQRQGTFRAIYSPLISPRQVRCHSGVYWAIRVVASCVVNLNASSNSMQLCPKHSHRPTSCLYMTRPTPAAQRPTPTTALPNRHLHPDDASPNAVRQGPAVGTIFSVRHGCDINSARAKLW